MRQQEQPATYRLTIDSFSGLDRSLAPSPGAWADMRDMTTADAPAIRTRERRKEIAFRADGLRRKAYMLGDLADAVSTADELALSSRQGTMQTVMRSEAWKYGVDGEIRQLVRYGRGVFLSPACVYLNERMETEQTPPAETGAPILDYAVEHDNRIFGCRYGYNREDEFVNEIYASALGSPCDFFSYEGLESDAWTGSVGSDGRWTGIAELEQYVVFFKERCFYLLSGSGPATYGYVKFRQPGVQAGSERSLAQIGGYLYYKSTLGVMRLSANSLPVCVSEALGPDRWTDAIAGTDGRRYYIQMRTETGEAELYVLDTQTGSWTRETAVEDLRLFARHGRGLYALVQPPEVWSYDAAAALAAASYTETARWETLDAESRAYDAATDGDAWLLAELRKRHVTPTEDAARAWRQGHYLKVDGAWAVSTAQRCVYNPVLAALDEPGAGADAAEVAAWKERDRQSRLYAAHEPAGRDWLEKTYPGMTDEAWRAWIAGHNLSQVREWPREIRYVEICRDVSADRLPRYGLTELLTLETAERADAPAQSWMLRSGPLGLGIQNRKRIREIGLRIRKETGRRVRIRAESEDGTGLYTYETDTAGGLTTYRARLATAQNAECVVLELTGEGDAEIYGVYLIMEDGGDGVC